MSSPYTYTCGPGVYDANVSGIRIRWQASGIAKLAPDAGLLGVPVETLKSVSEHFSFLLAYRLESPQVMIRSAPHAFTVDSKTNARRGDDDHITVEVSGGKHGRRKCHIYLKGHGEGPGAYDNVEMRGESVLEKKGSNRDATLCEGELDGVLYGAAAGNMGSSSSSQGATYSSWGAGYQTGGYEAGGGSGQESTSGEWVWSPEHRMYYHSGTGEWAPPQQ